MGSKSSAGDILNEAVAGMIGGAVASWVMNKYIAAQGQAAEAKQPRPDKAGGGDDATVKTAKAISLEVFEHKLTPKEAEIAGPAVHYAYGILVGGLYGALTEAWPVTGAGFGMAYGTALWALGDEIAVPALRLGAAPTQTPPAAHADALAAHLVYGIALDIARRVVRHVV